MSANDSYLEDARYGYDLVVGTTQAAINATLKPYLASVQNVPFELCYNSTNNPISTESLSSLDFDPFSLPADISPTDPRLEDLYSMGFNFGFKVTQGIPSYINPTQVPDIIQLTAGTTSVVYNLYAAEFQIVSLSKDGDTFIWENYAQSDDNALWIFVFQVDLNMTASSDAFNSLPQETQDEVKDLSTSSMFSVQQLYLDLNTAKLESMPDIEGLDPSSPAYQCLEDDFIGVYLESLHASSNMDGAPENSYVLNYAIQPEDSNSATGNSLLPSDLTFLVSLYNADPSNYDLYTLNWIVMTNGNPMPSTAQNPESFYWDWVAASETASKSGVMSIKRNVFVDQINQILSTNLNQICLQPSCEVNAVKIDFDLSFSTPTSAKTYNRIAGPNPLVLSFSFSADDDDDDDDLLVMYISMYVKYSLVSNVYFTGNTVQIISTATGYLEANIEGAKYKGNVCKYTTTVNYEVSVNDKGELSMQGGTPNCEDQSDDIDISWWGTLITFGNMDDIIKEIQTKIKNSIQDYASGYTAQLTTLLSSPTAFVFPGSDTFSFSGAAFSEYQDLVADVTYV